MLSDPDYQDWVQFLLFLSTVINNLTNASISFAPNELVYGFRVKDNLSLLYDLFTEDFNRIRIIKKEEVDDAIAFASAKNKIRYNTKYKDILLEVGNKAFFVLYRGYKVNGTYRKLGP